MYIIKFHQAMNGCAAMCYQSDYKESEGDFSFVGDDGTIRWYRPNDTFRIKVLGMFPRAGEGALIPQEWIVLARARWREINELKNHPKVPMRAWAWI